MSDRDPFADVNDRDLITTEYKPKLSFLQFWLLLLGQPEKFFREHFDNERSPYLLLVLMVVGTTEAANRVGQQLTHRHMRGELGNLAVFNHWPAFWGAVLALGLVFGGLHYALGGWWYDFRVGMAGGQRDKRTSRFLCLYSAFIPSVFLLYSQVCCVASHHGPIDAVIRPTTSRTMVSVLGVVTFVSIYVSWRGVTTRLNPSAAGAAFFFLIMPACLYGCAFARWLVTLG